MITVKLFGLLRLDSGVKQLTLEAASIGEVKAALMAQSDLLTKKTLERCVIFVNGQPAKKNCKLRDGDQVVLMSPVAGG